MLAIALAGLSLSPLASAEIVNNTHWAVKSGDSVYGIARKMFPNNTKLRAQFRRELVKSNADVFQGNASLMSVGATLLIPEFAVKKVKPAAVKIAPVEKIKPAPAKIIPVEKTKEEKPVRKMLAKKIETPPPAEIIGKVVINIGGMEAENNGDTRVLKRNSKIYKGDTLKTLSRSHTQLRFKDGALISLRPNTIFKIREYSYNGSEDGSEKSFFELIKGGFRTITGAIGHRNKQNYRVKTSVATIGIRGTHYGLMVCSAGDCQAKSNGGLEDGLYGGVVNGSIVINNKSGEHRFNNDQFFKLTSADLAPVETLRPPPILSDSTPRHGAQSKDPQHKTDHGKDNAEKFAQQRLGRKIAKNRVRASTAALQQIITSLPPLNPDQLPDNLQQQSNEPVIKDAPLGAVMGVAFIDSSAQTGNNFVGANITAGPNAGIKLGSLNGVNNLPVSGYEVAFDNTAGALVRRQFDIGNPLTGTFASPVPSSLGGSAYGVNWGRWQGQTNMFSTNLADGTTQTITQPANSNMHFIYSDKVTSLVQLGNLGGLGGNINYTTVAGMGTLPTDQTGAIDASTPGLANINMNVDFQNQLINSYTLDVTVNTQTYSMMASAPLAFNQLNKNLNLIDQVTSPCPSGTCIGDASVKFVGIGAEAALTSYSVGDSAGTTGVSGTNLLFRNGVTVK